MSDPTPEIPSPPSPPLPLDPPDGWERFAISAFLFFHLMAIQFWNMPTSYLQSMLTGRIGPYMQYTGLAQNWGMFAPEPGHENFYMEARITYQDKKVRSWPIGRQDTLNNAARLINERERKLVENLYDTNNGRPYYNQMALWMARRHFQEKNNPPVKVELMRFWNPIPVPPDGASLPALTEWHHDTVYSVAIDPKVFQ